MKISEALKKSLLHSCRFCGGKNKEVGVIYHNFRVHWICEDCAKKFERVRKEEEADRNAKVLWENSPWQVQ
jgi:transposase-like protein